MVVVVEKQEKTQIGKQNRLMVLTSVSLVMSQFCNKIKNRDKPDVQVFFLLQIAHSRPTVYLIIFARYNLTQICTFNII